MRSKLAIGFTFLYLIALCKPIAPLIEYYANADFFATVLCINKNKPEMHCHGRCVLMQNIKAAVNEKSGNAQLPKVDFKEYPIGFVVTLLTDDRLNIVTLTSRLAHYSNLYLSFPPINLFHPPRVIKSL